VFSALGRFNYRFRRVIPVAVLALVALTLGLGRSLGGTLSPGGFSVPRSNSQRAAALLAANFGNTQSALVVVYAGPRPDAASPAVQRALAASLSRLRQDPRVTSVQTYATTRDPTFLGAGGRATFAVVNLRLSESAASAPAVLGSLTAEVGRPPGLRVYVTGAPAIDAAYNSALQASLAQAELITLPICLVLLLLVFGSLVAAALPLLTAGLALPTALGVIDLLARSLRISIFVTNIVTVVGLGLAIDYALFLVKRFREELAPGDVEGALERTMASAGKAITVSGIAVAVGLASLMLFPATGLSSLGLGGVVVVLGTLLFALTALPAVLALLGPRVSAVPIHLPGRPPAQAGHGAPVLGLWARIARVVMRHPVVIAVPTAAVLLLAGTPFLRLQLSTGGRIADIPVSRARTGFALLTHEFPQAGGSDVMTAVLQYRRGSLTAGRRRQLAAYAARLAAVPGIASVTGALTPPPGVSAAVWAHWLAVPAAQRPAPIRAALRQTLHGRVLRLQLGSSVNADGQGGPVLVHRVRAVAPPPGARAYLTGGAAYSVDFLAAFDRTIPYALLLVVAVTLAVLFCTFGSVVLPLKAVAMSLVSISAAFGALVWIFQEGHFAGLLGFTPLGAIVATTPVLMFAVLFGLSMDYEVFLLSRIRERYVATGDTRRAVEEGLGATGGIITSAALIMVTVFGAFALGSVVEIKSLGLGMAIAVTVDATLVRGVLVPALMRLLGPLNWWAPAAAQALVARLGFYEEPLAPAPRSPVPPAAG